MGRMLRGKLKKCLVFKFGRAALGVGVGVINGIGKIDYG
jgi:hypothetical protein